MASVTLKAVNPPLFGRHSIFRPPPRAILAAAILGVSFTAWHNEILSATAWTFNQVAQSYLIQHMDNLGLGIGACFG